MYFISELDVSEITGKPEPSRDDREGSLLPRAYKYIDWSALGSSSVVVVAAVVVVASVVVSAEVIGFVVVVISARAVVVVSTEEALELVSTFTVVPVSVVHSDLAGSVVVCGTWTEAVDVAVSLLVAVSLADATTVDEETIDKGRHGLASARQAASRMTVLALRH